MKKIRGTVRREALEGGVYLVEAEDGATYQLAGGDAGLRKDGQKVELEGEVDEGAFGIGMMGPTFRVKTWRLRS